MSWDGYIAPVPIEQFREGRNGKQHLITADAGGVAERLKQIDKGLRLRYSEAGFYVVSHLDENGVESLVKTYPQCDGRIVTDIERIRWQNEQPGFSLADEIEKADAETDKRREHEFSEQIGEAAEKLHHAFRKDLGSANRAFISEGAKKK